ncbi:hypothetical protein GQ53DRAFT_769215 [Thozetella sp. PMI_491]|nr:hypothetical protein GQ53DRAFT_769215 [Thozetella sp. PMI_491]
MKTGEDGELVEARRKMDTALSRLQEATEFTTLRNIQESQDLQINLAKAQTQMLESVMDNQESAVQEPDTDTPKVLAIEAQAGCGKGHITAAAYDWLMAANHGGSGETAVAQFFFRAATKDLTELANAMGWIVIQLTECNAALCEKLNAELTLADIDWDDISYRANWEDYWGMLLKPLFSRASKYRLYIVRDGVDELGEYPDVESNLLQFLKEIATSNLNVSIAYTGRTQIPELEALGTSSIAVTEAKQLPDLQVLVWHNLNHDNGFRNPKCMSNNVLPQPWKRKPTVSPLWGRMLYAEHMLRRFDTMAREPLVMRQLETAMPKDMEELYDNILTELQRRIAPESQLSLRSLLTWLSFSFRSLTVGESLAVLQLAPGKHLDLEEALQGPLGQVLKIGGSEERVDEYNRDMVELSNSNGKDLWGEYDDSKLPLKFRERSLVDFFKTVIVCGEFDVAHKDLRKCATMGWSYHLSWLAINSEALSEDDRIAALDALGKKMSDEHGTLSKLLEASGIHYEGMANGWSADEFVDNVADWAARIGISAPKGTLVMDNLL